jgi:hypothetical protein
VNVWRAPYGHLLSDSSLARLGGSTRARSQAKTPSHASAEAVQVAVLQEALDVERSLVNIFA